MKAVAKVKQMSHLGFVSIPGVTNFQKIDNFIAYSFQKELEAMEAMGTLIRQKIESEHKI